MPNKLKKCSLKELTTANYFITIHQNLTPSQPKATILATLILTSSNPQTFRPKPSTLPRVEGPQTQSTPSSNTFVTMVPKQSDSSTSFPTTPPPLITPLTFLPTSATSLFSDPISCPHGACLGLSPKTHAIIAKRYAASGLCCVGEIKRAIKFMARMNGDGCSLQNSKVCCHSVFPGVQEIENSCGREVVD